jgi:hypothetical protein
LELELPFSAIGSGYVEWRYSALQGI